MYAEHMHTTVGNVVHAGTFIKGYCNLVIVSLTKSHKSHNGLLKGYSYSYS